MRYVVIIAGGSGKRLWPLSRQDMPKQLLNLVGGKSLLRIAFERVSGIVDTDHIVVCTGAEYADVVQDELPELSADNILGEPVGRDSLNAVAWPAAVLSRRDPDAVVAVLTADQIMHPISKFRSALQQAFTVVEADPQALVTFGVVPTSPHTGYGYLQRGAAVEGFSDVCEIQSFREKPDLATAREYFESQNYWWNSGMFVWRTETLLAQLEQLLPETHSSIRALAESPDRLQEIYPTLEKISVDYAVMEPVSQGQGDAHVLAVRLPISWHDVGGFAALGEQLPRDEAGNAQQGTSVLLDAYDNLVINQSEDGRVVAAVGLRDTVIVQTADITLVCPMSEAERIKDLVAVVTEQLGITYA